MDWDQIEGHWRQIKVHAKSSWTRLTDEDIRNVGGKRDVLASKLQARYGVLPGEAEDQINAWLAKFSPRTSGGKMLHGEGYKVLMNKFTVPLIATSMLALGCMASNPPPTQQMADVESATRSATELGANSQPKAQLHLKLAHEQTAQAKAAMEKSDTAGADRLLVRAKSDAELAVALMHEHNAVETANKASQQSASQRSTNASQEATP